MELVHHDTIRTMHADRLRAAEHTRLVNTVAARSTDRGSISAWNRPTTTTSLTGLWHRLVRRPAPAC